MHLRCLVICDEKGVKTNPELQYWDPIFQRWEPIFTIECKTWEENEFMERPPNTVKGE